MTEINVHLVDFHTTKASEMVCHNEDGSDTILLNARLDYHSQLKAYLHALGHVEHGDFEKCDVQEIERNAHS